MTVGDSLMVEAILNELFEMEQDQKDLADAGQVNILFRDGVEYAIKRIRKVIQ